MLSVALAVCLSAGLAGPAHAATFGKTSVGPSTVGAAANKKQVSRYALPSAGSVTKLSVYLQPTATSGQQLLKGVIYADAGGQPQALLGITGQLTFTSASAAGWYDLAFPAAVSLPAGNYWLGVITGATAKVAALRFAKVAAVRDFNANKYAAGPSNPFGAPKVDAKQVSLYATYTEQVSPPANVSPPTISGTAQQGQTLTESHGTWTNSPTSYEYQWLQCDSLGNGCLPIAGAKTQTYVPTGEDVNHTLRVSETASNAGGPSEASTSEATAAVLPEAPATVSPPTISGTAQQGQTLTESHGTWTNSPTSYEYQWLQCDGSGGGCAPISGAGAQAYVATAEDVGHTLRVSETARNAGGPSAAATSTPTGVVTQASTSATFGKTAIGASSDAFLANRKRVNRYSLPTGGSVNKLSIYLAPTTTAGQQVLKGVVYGDAAGKPGSLLATTVQLTFQSTNAAGWYDMSFASPLNVVAGNYWIGVITGATGNVAGFRYDSVASSRAYNANAYTSGPSDPFGTPTIDSEQMSLYATYTTEPAGVPVNTSPPTISGIAQQGQTLTANPGTWTGSPFSYSYEWTRCDSSGASCVPIFGATAATYPLTEEDVEHTLRVTVIASNAAGPSAPATSAQTAVVISGAAVSHLEYVLQNGTTSVYDIDHEFQLIKTIAMPQDKDEVRGVSVAPSTHLMYVMHGGDGPINGSGNGSVLAWDLVSEEAVWDVKLNTGIDSGQVSPDAKTLYIPTGENSPSGIWNVLSAQTGALTGTIQGGAEAHNTIVSNNGRYVYLGGHGYKFLDVYDTTSGEVKEVGPLVGKVRPLTVNGSDTLAFTTATGFDGFQVSSVTTGKVLFTVSFGEVPEGFRFTGPSHGISLSPDEKQVYVIDAVHKLVQFYDVSKVKEGVAPSQIGTVAVAGLGEGGESGCRYDCSYSGWLQLSLDGRYLFVGDSGEVIDTATRKVLTTLPTLAQTKKSIEVDWQNGVPVATSGRTGVGYVE